MDTLKENRSPIIHALWLQISERLSTCLPTFKVNCCQSKFQKVTTIKINLSFTTSIYFGLNQES